MPGVDYSGEHAKPRLDLGEAVMEYVEQTDEFIGVKALPIFKTPKKEATFSAVTRESITSEKDTKRSPRGGYNRDGIGAKDLSYKCIEHGFEGVLDDGERALYASDFDAELVISKITMRRVLLAQERRVAAILFDTSIWSEGALYTSYASYPWTNIATDIIGQVNTSKEKVRALTGLVPNTLICSQININRILSNSDVRDAVKYTARPTQAELLNALLDLFGLKKILVGKAIYNSSRKGQAFASADVWSADYVMIAVTNDEQDLSEPNVGRTFLWIPDSPENATVEEYRAEEIRSDVFRTRQHTDEKLIDKHFAHLIKVTA